MRKVLLFLLLFLVSNTSDANVNPITSKGSLHVVTSRTGGATINRLTPIVESPDVVYNSIQNSITIDFGVQPINGFTVQSSLCIQKWIIALHRLLRQFLFR